MSDDYLREMQRQEMQRQEMWVEQERLPQRREDADPRDRDFADRLDDAQYVQVVVAGQPERQPEAQGSLFGRMGSLQDIADPRGRKGLAEAAKLDAKAVRTVVVAETESGLASAIGDLREQLERRGWGRDKIDRTVRARAQDPSGADTCRRAGELTPPVDNLIAALKQSEKRFDERYDAPDPNRRTKP